MTLQEAIEPMTVATDRRMTLKEFLTYDDGTDRRYELVDGVLVEMGAESTVNNWIAMFFVELFLSIGLHRKQIGIKQKISVRSSFVSARDPDLIIHSEASRNAIAGRSEVCLFLGEPNPLIIIEIVSPGDESHPNYTRDYQDKPIEYADRGIPEYWIVDPIREVIMIGILSGGVYQYTKFRDHASIVSPTFPDLALTVAQILEAGND